MKKIYFSIFACFLFLNLSSCNLLKCKATAEILIKPHKAPFNEEPFAYEPLENGTLIKKPSYAHPAESEIVIIQSEPVVQRVIDKLKLETKEGYPLKTSQFKKNLKAKYKKQDNILYLSYKDSNSILAEKIIDTLLEVYIEDSISSIPLFTVFPNVSIPKANEKAKSPRILNKQEQSKIIAAYWKEIEEMNKDIPQGINLNKYQSHSIKIIKMANSSCS